MPGVFADLFRAMSPELNDLVGKTILGVFVSKGEEILSFVTPDEVLTFIANADCCSESWFADITGVNALLNATVRSVETISMDGYNVDDGRCRQEVDEVYGYNVVTDKGQAVIVYRNSSNGYYGGWLTGYSGELPSDMVSIKADWSSSPTGREYDWD